MGAVSEIELPATALSARTNFAFLRLALFVGRRILPTVQSAAASACLAARIFMPVNAGTMQ